MNIIIAILSVIGALAAWTDHWSLSTGMFALTTVGLILQAAK